MGNNAFYFSHDGNAHNDQKILELRAEWGWAGYGLYWALVELMFNAKDYKLRIDRLGGIALHLGQETKEVVYIIERCVELNLFVSADNQIFSESLLERMQLREQKTAALSRAGKRGAARRWATNDNNIANGVAIATAMPNDSKESKEKEKIYIYFQTTANERV